MKIKVNGKELNLFRTEARPHGWVDLFVGETQAESRVSVPRYTAEYGGRVFTSGHWITVPRGGVK